MGTSSRRRKKSAAFPRTGPQQGASTGPAGPARRKLLLEGACLAEVAHGAGVGAAEISAASPRTGPRQGASPGPRALRYPPARHAAAPSVLAPLLEPEWRA